MSHAGCQVLSPTPSPRSLRLESTPNAWGDRHSKSPEKAIPHRHPEQGPASDEGVGPQKGPRPL